MRPPRPPLAAALTSFRSALGLTQDEMAARLGLSRRTLSRWEGGHITPTLDDRVRVLAACNDVPRAARTALGVAFGLLSNGDTHDSGGGSHSEMRTLVHDGEALPEAAERAMKRAAESLAIDPERLKNVLRTLYAELEPSGVSLLTLIRGENERP